MKSFVTLEKLSLNHNARHIAIERHSSMVSRHHDVTVHSKVDKQPIVCWLPMQQDGVTPLALNKDGYAQVAIQKKTANKLEINLTSYLHQLAWWSNSNFDTSEIQKLIKLGDQGNPHTVSHLCNHSWCFNPEHVVVEPLWANLYRSNCLKRRLIARIKHRTRAIGNFRKKHKCQCHYGRKGGSMKFKRCIN